MTTKLLAVDDSKTLRKVLEITFAGEDFQTELAGSPDEALQKLRLNRPAIAVIDTSLGGEASGYDLCQHIKGEAPETRVILLSSKHRPYDQTRGTQVGADDYIDKPFDTQKLIDKVKELLASEARPAAAQAPPLQAPPPQAPPPQVGSPLASPPQAPPPQAPPLQAPLPQAPPPQVGQPSIAARQAPRPAVSAVPQRPVSHPQPPAAAPSRPASPSPQVSARPMAPAPTFGAGTRQPAPSTPAAPPASTAPRVAAAVAAAGADLTGQLQELGLDASQVQGVLALSREVVERVVWEVVPVLAETLIKEEIARITAE